MICGVGGTPSLNISDAIESGITPAGRYFTQDVRFIDDFDYGGQQDKQTACKFKLLTQEGAEYEVIWTVGPKIRIWPTKDGTGLVGAQPGRSSNFIQGVDQAIKSGGLPENRLAGSHNIAEAFQGWWADWDTFSPPGRTPNARGNMPTILVPMKIYLDGAQPAGPAVTAAPQAAPVQAPAPQAPPPQAVTAPAPAPSPAPSPAPAPAPTAAPKAVSGFYPEMVRLTKEMLQNDAVPNTRQQLSAEVFLKLMDGDVVAGLDLRTNATSAVFTAEFTAVLQAAGLTLTGEVIS
jgi:hypothetical protein